MTSFPDYSSSEADLISFLVRTAVALVIWVTLLSLVRRTCTLMASVFWSHPIPLQCTFIPSKLPYPNPPGSAVPFDIPLLEASEEDIDKFMTFVQNEKQLCNSAKHLNRENKKWLLHDVAKCSAAYKGQLVSLILEYHALSAFYPCVLKRRFWFDDSTKKEQ